MQTIDSSYKIANKMGTALHIDGIRHFEAVAIMGEKESDAKCDSIALSFEHCVGAPFGGMFVGSEEVVDMARKMRKSLGGGMRQVGVVCAAAYEGMTRYRENAIRSHEHARQMFSALSELDGIV